VRHISSHGGELYVVTGIVFQPNAQSEIASLKDRGSGAVPLLKDHS